MEVVIESEDKLFRKVFKFKLIDFKIILFEYYEQKRETKKHKYISFVIYNRIDKRSSTIKVEDIVISDCVEAQALQMVIDALIVTK